MKNIKATQFQTTSWSKIRNNKSHKILGKYDEKDLLFDSKVNLRYIKDEKIIKIKSGTHHKVGDNFQYTINGNELRGQIIKICSCGDSSLFLVRGQDIHNETTQFNAHPIENTSNHYLMYSPGGDDPAQQPRGGTVGGALSDVRYTWEDRMPDWYDLVEKFFKEANRKPKQDDVVVAVIDTGIDLKKWKRRNKSPLFYFEDRCRGSMLYGRNFVENSSGYEQIPFDDNGGVKHGSRIAKIIQNKSMNIAKILPLKVFNYEGFASFFDLFCSFEFILKHNFIKIINASWGYYGGEIPMFTDYMRKFKNLKIWFVNAAGNANDFIDVQGRDISSVIRYPACYSTNFDNVITVTSLISIQTKISGGTQNRLTAIENYSDETVDIGVVSENQEGEFEDPFINQNFVRGSSYATAFVAGKMVLQDLTLVKDSLINNLCNVSPPAIAYDNTDDSVRNDMAMSA